MKKLHFILQEAEEEMDVETPDVSSDIKNPSFVFEINGNFNFSELERLLYANESGLTLDTYELKIDTKGLIDDAAYEKFIIEVEKLKYLKFIR